MIGRRHKSCHTHLKNKVMCFFTSLSANAAAVAKRYGKQLDLIEAARQILAEQEQEQRANQEADPKHKVSVYDIRLAEDIYVIPAYAEPHCVIVSGSDELQVMQWGLIPRTAKREDAVRYDRENLFKNARAENLFDKWPWRMLWSRNRCIIPVTGFFEPHRLPDGKAQYYYTSLKDKEIFSIAGLWDEWTNPETGKKVLTFVLITTAANAMMRKIHNGGNNPFRMPKILTPEQERLWLDPAVVSEQDVAALLTVYPEEEMTARAVRQKFNYGDPFDGGIIKPVAEQQHLELPGISKP